MLAFCLMEVTQVVKAGYICYRLGRCCAVVTKKVCFAVDIQASSSIGRAAVSKTAGWGFDSLLACQSSPGW